MGEGKGLVPAAVEAGIGGIPVVGPFIAPFAGPLMKTLGDEHARRHSVAMKAAERESGMQREDLEETLAADPRLVSLTITLLYAAGMNGHDETLEMLGRVVGHTATEPQLVDVANDALDALRGLREGHLRVLAYANHRICDRSPEEGQADTFDDGRWSPTQAAAATGTEPELISGYIAGLVTAGLVTNPPVRTYPGASPVDFVITDFGRRLMELADVRRQYPTDDR